jgi:hypothetical protein
LLFGGSTISALPWMPVTRSIGPPSAGDARGDDARERAVVALDAHDPGGGHPQVGVREVAHADQVGGDERVLERDQRVQRDLRVRNMPCG